MTRSIVTRALLIAALAAPFAACKEEGRAERAGRKFDEAVEKLRHGDEGTLERAGREVDEAFEDARDEAKAAVEEIREKTADAIEGE
jgi:F0F1-type ATP synthase membrane subunit b/b'